MTIPTPEVLDRALRNYDAVIADQGVARLPELDRWYRQELPGLIAARAHPHLTHAELVRLTEWKMARGVWRAPNLALVRSNSSEAVESTSRDALSTMPDATKPIALLTNLKGVGPATASAITAAVAPRVYPFFDELVAAQLPGLGEVKWTLRYYATYAEILRQLSAQLGGPWTPTLLERALWAHSGGKSA